MSDVLDRIPPQSLEMEQAVLGAMLIEHAAVEKAAEMLRPEDFYRTDHRTIFEAILELASKEEAIDLYTVQEELRKTTDFGEGSMTAGYLVQLTDAVPSAVNIEHYAKVVSDKAVCRRLIDAGSRVVALGHAYYDDVAELTNEADRCIQQAIEQSRPVALRAAREVVSTTLDRIEQRTQEGGRSKGIMSGFEDFDYLTSGLKAGQVIIVGGRSSMGKTAFALAVMTNTLNAGHRTLMFSMEMNAEDIVERMLAAGAKVSTHALATGQLEDHQWIRIGKKAVDYSEGAFAIDEQATQTLLSIRGRIQAAIRIFGGVDLVIVDYLQLVSSERRVDNRVQEIGLICRGLKKIAKDFAVPVVCLSQLNRATDENKGSRPRLSNLRESGNIEQDADIVAFLHRPNYYLEPDKRKYGEEGMEIVELIIAKHRNGPCGECKIAWHGQWTRFDNLAKNFEEGTARMPYSGDHE